MSKKENETDEQYLERLMKYIYKRKVKLIHPVKEDSKHRTIKSSKVE
jgi:hypothetical protein